MSEKDISVVCSRIDEVKDFLNTISKDIWQRPEIQYKEVQAHATLTCALRRWGFKVQKHYFMPTAFRAEFSSKSGGGPTVAILLEYDALPDIGHACGHNLIAEAGLAAALGVKAAMEGDSSLIGKLVVLGTPAEEGGGGKIRLIELGAFDNLDAAMMVHPGKQTIIAPFLLCNGKYKIDFKGKASHAVHPWEGRNALDAAVACYQSISMLRQQLKPSSRIHAIITKGGTVENIIPAEASMGIQVRAGSKGELRSLRPRVEACITSAATATDCDVYFSFDEENAYENLISSRVMEDAFKNYAEGLGMHIPPAVTMPIGSSDMGNVSHVVPSIHVIYAIPTESINHTKGFAEAAGSLSAQEPTLLVSKAMALTALKVMRCPQTLDQIRRQFEHDIVEDMKC